MFIFFFNDTATTEIYTLSLHDALPICFWVALLVYAALIFIAVKNFKKKNVLAFSIFYFLVTISIFSNIRSEEHTSELQSQSNLVCRLLLEKKKSASCRWGAPLIWPCSH